MHATFAVLEAVADYCHFESYLLHKVYRFLDMCLQSSDRFWTSRAGHAGDMNITQQIAALERKLNFWQSQNLSVRQVKVFTKGPRLRV